MKDVSPALRDLLESSGARRFWSNRCVEIETLFGFTLRYTEADVSLKLPETGPGYRAWMDDVRALDAAIRDKLAHGLAPEAAALKVERTLHYEGGPPGEAIDAVFRHDGARVTFGDQTDSLGLSTDDVTITLAPIDTDGGVDPGITVSPPNPSQLATLASGTALPAPLMVAACNGLLQRARVTIWRAYAPVPQPRFAEGGEPVHVLYDPSDDSSVPSFRPVGAVARFIGHVGKVKSPAETRLTLTVKSALNLLNATFPRYVYRPGCVWTLFGQGCGVDRKRFEHYGTAFADSTTSFITGAPLDPPPYFNLRPPGYFDEGVLLFLNGSNAFVRRTIKQHTGDGNFVLAQPLPYPPTDGVPAGEHARFVVTPGCSKALGVEMQKNEAGETVKVWRGDCFEKFNNRLDPSAIVLPGELPTLRFRGFPNVPPPESITGTKMKNMTDDRLRLPGAIED